MQTIAGNESVINIADNPVTSALSKDIGVTQNPGFSVHEKCLST